MSEPSTPLLALTLDPAALEASAPGTPADPAAWLELALAAEAAGVGLVTLADTHRPTDGVARLDALMLAAYLGARTHRIGIVAGADTTVTEPYLLASQVGTADFVSAGRAGWLVQVSGEVADGAYVGPREAAVGARAWAEAAEFVAVVRALWDSWEDGAEIRDIANHRFIDRARIHHIDFAGEHLTIKGPSITPRSPQGQPPVAIEVAGPGPALELALGQADIVLLSGGAVDPAQLRADAAGRGRELRLLTDLDLDTASAHDLGAALADGFDGVRLRASALPEQLARLNELGAATRAASGTLRAQLGLPRPSSVYATPPAESAVSAVPAVPAVPAVSSNGAGR
jgi:alkanesulfonate monooxygenase SsuD/methylene tetrahydromethanopterin reductase-like flavin-dependent oxidoreductase (luciferase family)